MPLKHAYLIMAHGEWDILKALISSLDDGRNDIYVHVDSKVKDVPVLETCSAGLAVLKRREDVRWGDFSVVEAEYALFEEATENGPYAYYHLLSGQDLPLKSQDYIHRFFETNQGREFIGYTLTTITPEIVRKVQRWHLFPGRFRSGNLAVRALRSSFLRLQELLGLKRNRRVDFKKGSQWVSVTDAMARLFVESRGWAEKVFRNTFCSDEIVMQTLCWNSPLRENIWRIDDDAAGCMRAIGWKDGCLYDWTESDYGYLESSEALFARKFNGSDWDFIRKILALSR